GTTFRARFDTRTLPNPTQIQYPAVEVVADDLLGNHSTSGGILFTLDNVPPIGDLDPPDAVFSRCHPPDPCVCSQIFDPVGDDAASDLSTKPQVFDLRAQI